MMRLQPVTQRRMIRTISRLPTGRTAVGRRRCCAWRSSDSGARVALSSSFGAEDMVLIDMLMEVDPKARIVTLDTGRLPQETYNVMDATRERYGATIEVFFPQAEAVQSMVAEHGVNLFYHSVDNRKLCCGVRKMEPLRRALSGLDAWMTGLRREQSVTRTEVHKVEWDEANQLVKVNPLADWTLDDVWTYIREHNVPYNALHDRGYPSIGCAPCTRAVQPGERRARGTLVVGASRDEGVRPARRRPRARTEPSSRNGPVSDFREARRAAGPAGRAPARSASPKSAGCWPRGGRDGRGAEATPAIREVGALTAQLPGISAQFDPSDLDGVALVVAAVPRRRRARDLSGSAARAASSCNSVDDPDNCDFYYPAVVNRGDLQIAISTAGHSPALAQRLRHRARAAVRARVRRTGFSSWARRGASCSRRTWIRRRGSSGCTRWRAQASRSLGRVWPALRGGTVYLVGAGPGDPELLTLKALRILGQADVVLHDDLLTPEILELIPPTARVECVGKRHGERQMTQAGDQPPAVRIRRGRADGRPAEGRRRRDLRPRQRRDGRAASGRHSVLDRAGRDRRERRRGGGRRVADRSTARIGAGVSDGAALQRQSAAELEGHRRARGHGRHLYARRTRGRSGAPADRRRARRRHPVLRRGERLAARRAGHRNDARRSCRSCRSCRRPPLLLIGVVPAGTPRLRPHGNAGKHCRSLVM